MWNRAYSFLVSYSRASAGLLTPLIPSLRIQSLSSAQLPHLLTWHQACPLLQRGKGSPLLSSLRGSPECSTWGFILWACPEELGNQCSYQSYLLGNESHFKATLRCFIEVAFINSLKVVIRKTTGTERKLLRLGGETCKVSAAGLPPPRKPSLLQRAGAVGDCKKEEPTLLGCTTPYRRRLSRYTCFCP